MRVGRACERVGGRARERAGVGGSRREWDGVGVGWRGREWDGVGWSGQAWEGVGGRWREWAGGGGSGLAWEWAGSGRHPPAPRRPPATRTACQLREGPPKVPPSPVPPPPAHPLLVPVQGRARRRGPVGGQGLHRPHPLLRLRRRLVGRCAIGVYGYGWREVVRRGLGGRGAASGVWRDAGREADHAATTRRPRTAPARLHALQGTLAGC